MDWEDLLNDMTETVAETFAVSLIYERAATGEVFDKTPRGTPLTAIYDTGTVDSKDGASLAVSNRITVIDIRLADLDFIPAKRDRVTIPAGSFEVLDKDPSSSGMMKLKLGNRRQ